MKRTYVYSSPEPHGQAPVSLRNSIVKDVVSSFSPSVLRQTADELTTLFKKPVEQMQKQEEQPLFSAPEKKLQISGTIYLSEALAKSREFDHAKAWERELRKKQLQRQARVSLKKLSPVSEFSLTFWVTWKKVQLSIRKTFYSVVDSLRASIRRAKIQLILAEADLRFRTARPAFLPARIAPRLLHRTGTMLIGLALFGGIFLGAPFLALELRSLVFRMTAPLLSTATPPSKPAVFSEVSIPEQDKQFRIRIPMVGIDSQVLANVDMSNPKEYEEALKHGVAHAKGTGLPGDDGGINKTIVIFSHSTNGSWNITRYNALFYSLKDLKEEDQIQVWFWGKEYWYKVVEKKIVEPGDVSFLTPQMDKEKLILQTCWPPGTISKRLLIIAERVK